MKRVKRQRPSAIDLFSGCGGLTLGLKQAGFAVRAAVEIDARAASTYSANHPKVNLYDIDIRKLETATVLRDLGLQVGELDLLAGCPPCQGFSRLRTKNRSDAVADPRNMLIREFFRFVKDLRPKTVMMENVPALIGDATFIRHCKKLITLGYNVRVEILDAAHYEVAQRRKRLILLASRIHTAEVAEPSRNVRTVRDTIGSLALKNDSLHEFRTTHSKSVQKLISMIPSDGGSRADLPRKYLLECHKRSDGFSDVYGRMAWNKVAPTITSGCVNPSKGRFLHPVENRAITLREAALLQGFPSNYKFEVGHGKESIALMIGNALPPPFIAAHARGLRRAITSHLR